MSSLQLSQIVSL